jgi:chemotaxis protein MotA
MELNVFAGILLAIVSILIGAPDMRTDIGVYLNIEAFILVLGGTFASSLISSSFGEFKHLIGAFKAMMRGKQLKPVDAVNKLVEISEAAQRSSRQDLVNIADGVGDGYLKRGLQLVAAGLEKEFIDRALFTDINEVNKRHNKYINQVRTMGSFAPMFGMAGTVIGVIQVLKNVTDIENIVSGMALALLTTLYGLFMTSILFIPLANKLKENNQKEIVTKQIIREGILMIYEKEIPLKVEKYLMAFLKSTEKDNDKSK